MTDVLPYVIGHEGIRKALEEHLPPVTLLQGPASVGKRTLAEHLIRHHQIQAVDILRFEQLTAEHSREILAFARTAPFGPRKVVFARLDGASETSLNALLKLLEEPPRSLAVLFAAVWPPLDTIASRSHVHRLGLLPQADLVTVLTQLGIEPHKAARMAELGRGQVKVAMGSEISDTARNSVLSVLKAIKDGDRELLEAAAGKWDHEAHDLLRRWINEAITGRWTAFTESETFGLAADRNTVRRMLIAHGLPARPKLALRAGFLPLLEKSNPNT